ncbi:MAG TPA: radical SAM protein [Dissulfurispiraceae bacterium]|nr:radical SAM protein [Dissulfurispiraceae bacterium]
MNRKLIEKADSILAGEKGTVFKDPGGKISVCLVYPNTYHVGMSNLGFQGIYGLLNSRNDVVCERAFLPDDADIGEYRRTATPVFSLESKKPLNNFDIVAFSLSFENDYPNALRILSLSNIPFKAGERGDYMPLIVAGGVCVSFNPEPMAPALDIIFIGEAEESLKEFMDICKRTRSRSDVLARAAQISGVYVPSAYEVNYGDGGKISRTAKHGAPEIVRKRYIKDLSLTSLSTTVLTSQTEFSGMHLIEIMRGCPWSCRFCLVGNFFNPPRKKDIEQVTKEVEDGKRVAEKIGIIGPSLSDYPRISEVLCMEGVQFSITSLRASSRSAELVALLKGHKSVSIAPEAGTDRLRKVINKQVTEQDILTTARLLFETGIETLRLYFMIGLPAETDEDIAGIVELAKKIRSLDNRPGIVLSISTFIPKPFTPFQWHPMERLDPVKRKIRLIKKSLETKGIKVFHDVPKYAHMQGLFSLGDQRIFPVIERMVETDDYRKACADEGIDMAYYIFRQRPLDETLPLDFIDIVVAKEKIWVEYLKAVAV